MRLTVIGCAGSFPNPSSAASCYLVEHDGTSIVLDLGPGSLGPLAAATDIRTLDAVVLSHLHADHCLDLAGMYVARKYHPDGPPPPLAVYGPRGTGRRIADAYRTSPGEPVDGLERIYRFVDLSPDAVQIGPFTITVARVAHPVPAYAIRVDAAGASLVYSGDTGPTPALVELTRGADLALFEASCLSDLNNPKDLHMTGVQAAEHAAAAGAGRLVLTHLVAWNDPGATLAEGRSAFEGDVVLATPGMVVEL
ncbi:MAG: MBL fold metallo-hydrolase [Candidatus Nanopelagicales bacterium]|nr:MBL fold metallo-hydrolase [Candidatus Nanopelagicales bacterium]